MSKRSKVRRESICRCPIRRPPERPGARPDAARRGTAARRHLPDRLRGGGHRELGPRVHARAGHGPVVRPRAVPAARGDLPRQPHSGGVHARPRLQRPHDGRAGPAARRQPVCLPRGRWATALRVPPLGRVLHRLRRRARTLRRAWLRADVLRPPAIRRAHRLRGLDRRSPRDDRARGVHAGPEAVYTTIYRASIGWDGGDPISAPRIASSRVPAPGRASARTGAGRGPPSPPRPRSARPPARGTSRGPAPRRATPRTRAPPPTRRPAPA